MLELVFRVCGRKKKRMGAGISGGEPPGAHEIGGMPYRGGALLSRGLVLAPFVVFSVPKILKYSRKKHTKFVGHLEHFYFRTIFLMHEQFRKQTDNTIFALFILNNRK